MPDSTGQVWNNAHAALRAAGAGQATWRDAAQAICRAVGADAAGILVWRTSSHELECQEGVGFDIPAMREYGDYYRRYDVLLQRHPPVGQWQVSDERFRDAQWSRHPFFGDFLHRHRIRQISALTLLAGDDYKVGLILQRHMRMTQVARDFDRGPLRHLTREAASAFETRYGMAMAVRQSLHEALAVPGRCCFVADVDGRVQALAPGQDLPAAPEPLAFRHGRIFHADANVARRVSGLMAQATQGARGSVTVPGRAAALRIEAQPLPVRARLTGRHALALVQVHELGSRRVPDEADLRAYFGLTSAQARVLSLLCEGASVTQCAERLCCSVATVRTHVSALLLRMSCRRQAELVQAALMLT